MLIKGNGFLQWRLSVLALGLVASFHSAALAAPACEQVFAEKQASATLDLLKNPQLTALLQKELITYAMAILKTDPREVIATKNLSPRAVRDLGETPTTRQEAIVLKALAELVDSKQLPQALELLVAKATEKADSVPQLAILKNLPPEKKQFVLATLEEGLTGLVQMRGLSKATKGTTYVEWAELSRRMVKKVDQSPDNFLHFSKNDWVRTEKVEVLVDGPASFALREKLIGEAKKSVDVVTWSIYDDMTGFSSVQSLIQKKNANVKVRAIVDGQVARRPGHSQAVRQLEEAGIEVIRWFSKDNPFQGQHRKMIIVDGEHVIAGGLNMGDVYSHKNSDPKVAKWRDTDIYIKGDGANQARRLFADLWNEQVATHSLGFARAVKPALLKKSSQGMDVSIIESNPTKNTEGSPIMLTLLKGIRDAKKSVDIENAYIILFPALKSEIQAAIARGVNVRVLTNSNKSVDEPIVSIPILRSAQELAEVGAHVYLKKGDTLHSKFVVIDGEYSVIMSYNLHPRSERMEGEMAVVVKSREFADNMKTVFDRDIHQDKAEFVANPESIVFPPDFTSLGTLRLFFDLL
ncbi:Major cardiolipin synthase ClsA [compost metagenome]